MGFLPPELRGTPVERSEAGPSPQRNNCLPPLSVSLSAPPRVPLSSGGRKPVDLAHGALCELNQPAPAHPSDPQGPPGGVKATWGASVGCGHPYLTNQSRRPGRDSDWFCGDLSFSSSLSYVRAPHTPTTAAWDPRWVMAPRSHPGSAPRAHGGVFTRRCGLAPQRDGPENGVWRAGARSPWAADGRVVAHGTHDVGTLHPGRCRDARSATDRPDGGGG